MSEKLSKKIVIVGAGLTGLTAAYQLARQGKDCLLLEREGRAGGMCRSYRLDDIIFDLGPHFFFSNPDFEAENFLSELLEGEEVISKRFRFAIYTNRKYWKFPIGIMDILFYPWKYKKIFLANFFARGKNTESNGMSVKDDIVKKSGSSYYREVFAAMLKRKTLSPGEQVHKDWVARIDRDVHNRKEVCKELSQVGLFRKILKTIHQTYLYPAKGFELFPAKIMEKYLAEGGEVVFNCGPIEVQGENNNIKSVTVQNQEYPVEDLIWTGSVNSLNKLLGKEVPELTYVKTIIAFLTFNSKKPVPRPFAYVYYPEGGYLFNRVYFPSSIYGNKQSPGKEGICLEINCLKNLDQISDQDLIEKAIDDVHNTHLFKKEDFRQGKVVRLGECLPVYSLDYEKEMASAYSHIRDFTNLYSVGRLGGYFFCMSPPAVSQGLKIARHVLKNR